uniref:Trafficking protein particle complex subunit n=1 Tax=Panagrellus redivivus TaxID=6233 RepID=A0A7E4VEK0_PANRE
MTLFNFYLFNPKGECICYKEWRRDNPCDIPQEGEFQLVFGMIHSLRSFAQKIVTRDGQQQIKYFKTSSYKMNYMETATGLKFVLNSDPDAVGIPELLREIYSIFVATVIKNPLVDIEAPVASSLFHSKVDELIRAHQSFA